MQTFNIAVGQHRDATQWPNKKMSFEEFSSRCADVLRTDETLEKYLNMPGDQQDPLKDKKGGYVCGEVYNGGRRLKKNILNRSAIALDADFAEPDLWENYIAKIGHAAILYTTHKHQQEKKTHRYRLIIPTNRPVRPEEYEPLARMVTYILGIEQFDKTTYDINRLMYWPTASIDGVFRHEALTPDAAGLLDVDAYLGRYEDWRDVSGWHYGETENKRVYDKIYELGDPRKKLGDVGAICRAYYPITELFTGPLEGYYVPGNTKDRYTYHDATTTNGAIVYKGLHIYSNHHTDPACGVCCNAFDALRIHKFLKLDSKALENTPVNKLPSYVATVAFIRGDQRCREQVVRDRLEKAQADLKALETSEPIEGYDEYGTAPGVNGTAKLNGTAKKPLNGTAQDTAKPEIDEDSIKWIAQLEMANNKPVTNVRNFRLVLENDKQLKNKIGLNEFTCRLEARGALPWNPCPTARPWQDEDWSGLNCYTGELPYELKRSPILKDVVNGVIKQKNKQHPVRNYIDGLTWDGTPRVETLFIDFLGAANTLYIQQVTRKTLIGAVARVYEPGCKVEHLPTLVGPQGIGKSTLIRRLGVDWFLDTFNFHMVNMNGGIRAIEQIQGSWIIEIGEMTGLRKADAEGVKVFVSSQEDQYRPSYGEEKVYRLRQCIFIGSSNVEQYIIGQDNRRHWPVKTRLSVPRLSVWNDLTPDYVGQLWAEAFQMYLSGEPAYLSPEVEALARFVQMQHSETDLRDGIIHRFMEMPLPPDWNTRDTARRRAYFDVFSGGERMPEATYTRGRICAAEIWTEAFGFKVGDMTAQNTRFIHNYLRALTGWQSSDSKLAVPNYGRQTVYDLVFRHTDTQYLSPKS